MNKAGATIMVKAFAAAENEPQITDGEIEVILSQCLRPDSAGLYTSDSAYVENYDANYGVTLAWKMKMGKAAGAYTFLDGGSQFIRSDMIRHCTQMYEEWRKGNLSCPNIGIEDRNNREMPYIPDNLPWGENSITPGSSGSWS